MVMVEMVCALTVLIVHSDCVSCPMGFFVIRDHHGNVQFFQPFAGECDTYVPAATSLAFVILRDVLTRALYV